MKRYGMVAAVGGLLVASVVAVGIVRHRSDVERERVAAETKAQAERDAALERRWAEADRKSAAATAATVARMNQQRREYEAKTAELERRAAQPMPTIPQGSGVAPFDAAKMKRYEAVRDAYRQAALEGRTAEAERLGRELEALR